MIRIAIGVIAAAALGVALTGCNNNNNLTFPNCSVPAGMQYSLVYPAPNSTGNSTTVSQVIVATSGPLPAQWQQGAGWDVVLGYPPGGGYPGSDVGNGFVSTAPPFPTPNTTPPFSNPSYWSSSISYAANANPSLPPGTQIGVYLNNLNTNCTPSVLVGSFST
jgi:hypothetical protein